MSRKFKTAKDAVGAATKHTGSSAKHVFVLMDESGSMRGLEEAVTTGCNEFIHEFKDDEQARVWLAWFDKSPGSPRTRVEVRGLPAATVEQLTPDDYNPRGMTPLNDAIADSVAVLDAAVGEEEVVFLAIVTDGLENASEHSTESIRELLTAREEAGWGVVFVGANQDTKETAARFGMYKPGRAFDFDADIVSVRASMRGISDVAKLRTKQAPGRRGRERYDRLVEMEYAKKRGRLDDR